ncbi:UNVERIFIED_CONTAM: hypothetical protein Sradi_2089300 [Sesamum radiatum]|uniref:Uncharacterized protein n=1 Tax=Sesamum radiatum TaxID=300843 RepID=A0AAW2THS4_SESRA
MVGETGSDGEAIARLLREVLGRSSCWLSAEWRRNGRGRYSRRCCCWRWRTMVRKCEVVAAVGRCLHK